MKFVLNIGMHKTGTSSIQSSFADFATKDSCYLPIGNPNHSALYFTMFSADPNAYPGHRKNNRSEDYVAERKAFYFDKMKRALRKTKFKKILSSAEDVSNLNEAELTELRDWIGQYADEIKIIGYVRPPNSFMSSAIQQRVAGGISWRADSLYPKYRARFEKFDNVFGRENVDLVKFDRSQLYEGNVVLDFAKRAGVEFTAADVKVENVSRSLETTSIVAAQRLLGEGFRRYQRSPIHNRRMIEALRPAGDGKIVLHADFVKPVLAQHADDMDWISARLGTDFIDTPKDAPDAIRSNDDMLKIASSHLPDVLKQIEVAAGDKPVDPKIVAKAVDLLLDVIKSRDVEARAQNVARRKKRGLGKKPQDE